MKYNYRTALAEQIDDMAVELDEIRQDRERLIKENKQLKTELIIEINKYDNIELDLDDAERHLENRTDERDTLAYENKNMAEFIKYNDSTLTDTDVGDIACGTPDVWDRFVTKGKGWKHLVDKNVMLRHRLREIKDICEEEV